MINTMFKVDASCPTNPTAIAAGKAPIIGALLSRASPDRVSGLVNMLMAAGATA